MPQYIFKHSGGTTGKSGKAYNYQHGVAVVAPAGEFDHLGEGAFEVSDEAPVAEGVVVAEAADGTEIVSATPGTPPDPAASQAGFPAEQTAFDDSPLPSGTEEPNVKKAPKK